jgi:hypothetical protein
VILAAAVLVVAALGLFGWGIATGATALYWACVAVAAGAAVLLVVARLRMRAAAPEAVPDAARSPARDRRTVPHHAGRTPVPGAVTAPAQRRDAAHGGAEAYAAAATGNETAESVSAPEPGGTVPVAAGAPAGGDAGDPPVEEVEVSDLLLVVDLHDEVLVVDEHPRYHVAGCTWLAGREAVPLPVDEARTDGFTPCGVCTPDRSLAEVERARRSARPGS